ncbi:MAG: non-homologous end-joining DNA ligase [Bacillota bacterium]
MTVLDIGGRRVKVSNLDKLWWPQETIRKGDVINYYIAVAPWLLPHLRDRPLVLTRYPDGPDGNSFYQKNVPAYAPDWLRVYPLASEKRTINYLLVDDLAALVWVINSGGFEIHPFLSRIQHVDNPDFVVFDLDPMERASWQDICQTAMLIRQALQHWHLRGWPKLSGASGLQIFVPIVPIYSYEAARDFALMVAQAVQAALPGITTLERRIAKREGKLYLDCLQNARGKTLATVYGVRPQPGATVSMPITWDEVAEGRVRASDFTIHTALQRLQSMGDLFSPVLTAAQTLDHVQEV